MQPKCHWCGGETTQAYLVRWCDSCARAAEPIALGVSTTQILSDVERKGLMEHRQYYENRAADVKSGALKIKENGPLEFRPKFEKTVH